MKIHWSVVETNLRTDNVKLRRSLNCVTKDETSCLLPNWQDYANARINWLTHWRRVKNKIGEAGIVKLGSKSRCKGIDRQVGPFLQWLINSTKAYRRIYPPSYNPQILQLCKHAFEVTRLGLIRRLINRDYPQLRMVSNYPNESQSLHREN